MKKVSIGGDRIGAGKRMQVDLHGYERSTHDMGYIMRTTASPGTLIPFISQVALPGDTWDIELDSNIMTHPTLGPLLGSFKAQYDVFLCPIRLYNSWLHNNMLNIGRNMSQVKLPQLSMLNTNVDDSTDLDNSQINPSCILKYLGISGVGIGTGGTERQFNALPFISYWDVYKNYYANKVEEIGAVIHTTTEALVESVDTIAVGANTVPQDPAISLVEFTTGTRIDVDWTGTAPVSSQIMIKMQYAGWKQLSELARFESSSGTTDVYSYNFGAWGTDYAISWRYRTNDEINTAPPKVTTFPLINIDTLRQLILASPGNDAFVIDSDREAPYKWPVEIVNDYPNALNSQEGLAVKTYQNDLFNNWINADWIDGPGGITEVTAISTAIGDKFTIDTLNLSQKVYKMLNRIAISDGSFDSWIEVVYDQNVYGRTEIPIYCGGLSKELVFQEIVSNSGVTDTGGSQPLGTLAGKGVMSKKHKGGQVTIKVAEPAYIIGLFSLTPRIDYSQGNTWDTHLLTLDDLHKPALDEIGFQELIKEQMAWWDTRYAGGIWTQQSAGKQPAWINYMTNVNKCYGNFAIQNNEMFMTLNRRYEYDPGVGIFDMTTYIDPVKYNFIFANTAIDAQNFWVQIAVDATVRRKMSAKIMPNL